MMPRHECDRFFAPVHRRGFLASSVLAMLAGRSYAVDPLEPFDQLMAKFLVEQKIPGAALAVARHGKVVYARGFGVANQKTGEFVQPESLFRIASLSKPITAVAILQLVEQGKIALDDAILTHMPLKPLLTDGAAVDDRWTRITIRQCLQHTAGWDRAKSYDPIVKAWEIAKAFSTQPPVSPTQIVRYMMGQPLDFDPGLRYAYSNLGYLILGRIIEAVSGLSYEAFVQKQIFAPLGVSTARLGRALYEHRATREVTYYDSRNGTGRCLYPPKLGETVPIVYGGMNFEAYEAHGGWIASAVDLVKFASAFDDRKSSPLLKAKSIEAMWARPDQAKGPVFYALGWQVRIVGDDGESNQWHTGYIPGSEALLVRRRDGLSWAVLFNTNSSTAQPLSGRIDPKVHSAANTVNDWPADQKS